MKGATIHRMLLTPEQAARLGLPGPRHVQAEAWLDEDHKPFAAEVTYEGKVLGRNLDLTPEQAALVTKFGGQIPRWGG